MTNIIIDETSCLPKCSGLQISSYDKESIKKNNNLVQDMDTAFEMQLKVLKNLYEGVLNLMLPASLTSWSKFYSQ